MTVKIIFLNQDRHYADVLNKCNFQLTQL